MKYFYLLVLTQVCCASDSEVVKKQDNQTKPALVQDTKKTKPKKMTREMAEALDDETFAEMIRKPGAYQKIFGNL
jgi:hypothetical protein